MPRPRMARRTTAVPPGEQQKELGDEKSESIGGRGVGSGARPGWSDGDGQETREDADGSITVAFGTGNNNSQAGNTPNHHIIPQEFKVRITKARKLDGTVVVVPATVNFVVSGFHWVWVYQNGVSLEEVVAHVPPAAGTFVNYEVITAASATCLRRASSRALRRPSSTALPSRCRPTQNRTDTIAFSTPGRYLVICNVRGHFIDGMYAWVRVVDDDDDDDDDHGGHGM